MKIFSKTHFTFLAFLLAFSFSLQSFGQPTTRKEGDDGNGGDNCDGTETLTINSSSDQTVTYYIEMSDTSYLDSCDLYAGFGMLNSTLEYVEISGFIWVDSLNMYQITIEVTFSHSDILSLCENNNFVFSLYCLNEGEYDPIEDTGTNRIKICCEEEDETTPPDTIRFGSNGSLISFFENDLFRLNKPINYNSEAQNISSNILSMDYYLFDMHGNHIKSLKGKSKDQNIEKIISNLSIPAGLYFIRYLNDGKIKTKKIFKL